MGYVVEEGETFKKVCHACREKIELISTGADICNCPYCGFTLSDHEASQDDVKRSLDEVLKNIMKYRNCSDEYEKGSIKILLKNKLYWLLNDLEFLDKNQNIFHRWACSCGWTGFEPKITLPKNGISGKTICPKCHKEPYEKP